eukprot:jgi/Botrbrau1/9241/Bobra.180_1s0003.1
MASKADLDAWVASGGTIKQLSKGKVFVSASGEQFRSWQKASKNLVSNKLPGAKGQEEGTGFEECQSGEEENQAFKANQGTIHEPEIHQAKTNFSKDAQKSVPSESIIQPVAGPPAKALMTAKSKNAKAVTGTAQKPKASKQAQSRGKRKAAAVDDEEQVSHAKTSNLEGVGAALPNEAPARGSAANGEAARRPVKVGRVAKSGAPAPHQDTEMQDDGDVPPGGTPANGASHGSHGAKLMEEDVDGAPQKLPLAAEKKVGGSKQGSAGKPKTSSGTGQRPPKASKASQMTANSKAHDGCKAGWHSHASANGKKRKATADKPSDAPEDRGAPVDEDAEGASGGGKAGLEPEGPPASRAVPKSGTGATTGGRGTEGANDGEGGGKLKAVTKRKGGVGKGKETAGEGGGTEDEEAPSDAKVGSGRAAAQNVRYAAPSAYRASANDCLEVSGPAEAETELEALEKMGAKQDSVGLRISDFQVVDEAGEQQPLDSLSYSSAPLYLSGILYPKGGSMKRDAGVHVSRVGPLRDWRLDCEDTSARICVKSPLAEYICCQPAPTFKKVFVHLRDRADVAFQVVKALSSHLGGKPDTSMEEVVVRLARNKVGKGYGGPRMALAVNANFIMGQLELHKCGSESLAHTAFAAALAEEAANLEAVAKQQGGGITIRDEPKPDPVPQEAVQSRTALSSAEEARLQADADLARQLQAKLDAVEARGPPRKGGAKGQPYIKISESEIADDYPMPAQYVKEEEEADELMLMDEDLFDAPPEDLPRCTLTDFSIYNAEGFLASLELLPMWSGVEPDLELYASGCMLEDDGEWAGAQSLTEPSEAAGSSSAGPSGSGGAGDTGTQGMWLSLSQIQEWIVEFSCDMLFISIRTDAAWYRLVRPAAKYEPWFKVVLKTARIAVKVLSMLAEEARASRLSFADIIKRLAETPEDDPTFVSKREGVVERFVVVHGQIILNQFRNFPNKNVQRAAFVGSLRQRLELRRHSKLFYAAKKKLKNLRANPMRDRAAVRARPMTATRNCHGEGHLAILLLINGSHCCRGGRGGGGCQGSGSGGGSQRGRGRRPGGGRECPGPRGQPLQDWPLLKGSRKAKGQGQGHGRSRWRAELHPPGQETVQGRESWRTARGDR